MVRLAVGLGLVLLTAPAMTAAELTAYPRTVSLTGPRAVQQLVVADVADGRAVADHTADAEFTSDHPDVAAVSESGLVRAAGDGSATITATVGGRTVTIPVTVTGTGSPTPPSFRHQVLPTLTRTGCNSGACHGALAGKGGFKLSLRAYDPEADHFALTRQALARRVDTAEPAESLVLLKATNGLRHGGGTRFDDDSDHYRLLIDWIAAGAVGPTPADPTLERVDVFPPAALLGPGKSLRLIVRATVLRRADRGRDPLGQVHLQRGASRHGRRGRSGERDRPRRGRGRGHVRHRGGRGHGHVPVPEQRSRRSAFAAPDGSAFVDELILSQAEVAEPAAVAAVLGRRVHPPGQPRRLRRVADAGGSRRLLEGHRRRQAGQAGRPSARPAGVRRLLDAQVVRPAAGLVAEVAGPGHVVVLPGRPPVGRGQPAVGRSSPGTS